MKALLLDEAVFQAEKFTPVSVSSYCLANNLLYILSQRPTAKKVFAISVGQAERQIPSINGDLNCELRSPEDRIDRGLLIRFWAGCTNAG